MPYVPAAHGAAAPATDVVFAAPVVAPSGADPVSGDPAVAATLAGAASVGWRNQSSSAIYANSDEIPGGPFSANPYILGSPETADLHPALDNVRLRHNSRGRTYAL